MRKRRIKYMHFMGCLVLTVLLLCGCAKESDLEISLADSVQESSVEPVAEKDSSAESGAGQENDAKTILQGESLQSAAEKAPEVIYVQVTGAVCEPGVYELPEGSRVFEAIEKAGGMTEEAAPDSVNQALPVTDGEMIILFTKEEWQTAKESGTVSEKASADGSAEQSDGRVNINTADMELLCTIPGIGQTRAQSILTYREQNGAFGSIEEIKKVSGIKDGLFQKIKDKIKV